MRVEVKKNWERESVIVCERGKEGITKYICTVCDMKAFGSFLHRICRKKLYPESQFNIRSINSLL